MEIDDEVTAPPSYLFFERQSIHNGSFDFANINTYSNPVSRKKKKREERDTDSEEEDLCERLRKMQKNSEPNASEVQDLLEHWSLTSSGSRPKPNWDRIREQLRNLLSIVNTTAINEMIEAERLKHCEIFKDEKAYFQWYKDLFIQWCITTGSSKRLGHIYIGTAVHIWALLFRQRCHFFDMWVAFLIEKKTQYVSRDTWNLFFEFCAEFNSKGFHNYSFDACWPTLNDEFVNFYKEHLVGSSEL